MASSSGLGSPPRRAGKAGMAVLVQTLQTATFLPTLDFLKQVFLPLLFAPRTVLASPQGRAAVAVAMEGNLPDDKHRRPRGESFTGGACRG